MEPSAATYEKMGALCLAWSYLEMETEKTLIGLLSFNQELSRIFLWRMGMRQRWQMIVDEADTFLPSTDVSLLKAINKNIAVAMRDRNIIVHGLVNASLKNTSLTPGSKLPIATTTPEDITPPCWTIFMGEGAGKRYLMSTDAVRIVLQNVQKLGDQLLEFNRRHGFKTVTEINSEIERDWPKRI